MLLFSVFRIICSIILNNSHVCDFFFPFYKTESLDKYKELFRPFIFKRQNVQLTLSSHCPFGYHSFSESNIWMAGGYAKLPDQYPGSDWCFSSEALLGRDRMSSRLGFLLL